jgi:hypothetical protein
MTELLERERSGVASLGMRPSLSQQQGNTMAAKKKAKKKKKS